MFLVFSALISFNSLHICNMQGQLDSERQRADESEKKYSEALESIKTLRQKLEETERRVF